MTKELSVALCAIVKDEANYIEEWLAFDDRLKAFAPRILELVASVRAGTR